MSLAQIMGQGMNQGISSTGLPNIPIPNSIQMPMQDMNQRVSNFNSPQVTNGDSISYSEKIHLLIPFTMVMILMRSKVLFDEKPRAFVDHLKKYK
jgi:hypothetical protein